MVPKMSHGHYDLTETDFQVNWDTQMVQNAIHGNCQGPHAGLHQINFCVTGGNKCSSSISFTGNAHRLVLQALNAAEKELLDIKQKAI